MPIRTTPARASRVLAVSALALTLGLGACGGSGAQSGTSAPASPGAGASSAPASAAAEATRDPLFVDHATGPADVVLRVAELGGFMLQDTVMARVPLFTLYGDGRVLVVPAETAKAAPGVVGELPQLRETQLEEDQVQALLRFALTDGQLGVAKEEYAAMVMDLPTTVFTVNAGGVTKTVSVPGLGVEPLPGPDVPVLASLASLVQRLREITTDAAYVAPGWVAVLTEVEPDPALPANPDWPWSDLAPADFTQPREGDAVPFPHHLLTDGQATAAGADPAQGGATGLRFDGPDARPYLVVIRPALPEEIAAA